MRRPKPPPGKTRSSLDVLTSEEEVFSVKRRLLRPCIALTHAVRSEDVSSVHVDVPTLVFDRSAAPDMQAAMHSFIRSHGIVLATLWLAYVVCPITMLYLMVAHLACTLPCRASADQPSNCTSLLSMVDQTCQACMEGRVRPCPG